VSSRSFGGGSYRRGTEYSVSYPTLPSLTSTLPKPQSIVITQKQYSHDVAVLEFPVLNQQAMSNLKTGVPVSFTWTKDGNTGTWVGYVAFVSSELSATPRKRLEIHCIGSSFPLKTKKTRVFKNKTIPQVAEILAKEHGFKFVGEPNPRVFSQLTISGQSYWEWLQEQAKRIGYAMLVEGMTLVFRPIDKLIDHSVSNTPVLAYFSNDIPTDTLMADRTLDYFKVLNGEYIEGGELRNTKTVGGVDPVTGRVLSSSKSPKTVGTNVRTSANDVFFQEHKTGQVVHDATSAAVAAEGAAHMARFSTPATVKCQGDPRIKPYAPVYVTGVSDNLDGYWITTNVKHIMTIAGEYQLEMTVASDGLGNNKPTFTRTADLNYVGLVDLEAAIANGGISPSVAKQTGIALHTKTQIHKESGQGYNRTPTVWKSAAKPVRKVTR
jgi:phage protein D